eukprot:Pgem_evm1s2705
MTFSGSPTAAVADSFLCGSKSPYKGKILFTNPRRPPCHESSYGDFHKNYTNNNNKNNSNTISETRRVFSIMILIEGKKISYVLFI